jgi:predicted ATP-grasp superfamily ATP-dependent carboligase
MTTVFVYEDVTATGAGGDAESPPAPSLLAEGRAMLEAVTADFRAVPGVRVLTSETSSFDELARTADNTLVIAPETGGRLERLCREVLRVGGRLLGPSPDAIRLTADKLALARHWERHKVPTPTTWELGQEPRDRGLVIKPRGGAGSQNMSLIFPSPSASGGEGPGVRGVTPARTIAQDYIPGFAASVAYLVGPTAQVPLVPCQQLLSDDGHFSYLGGRLPIRPDLAERTVRIASQAVACVPGLSGYVGVDVVLGNDGRDWAIELNPRLTTSYVGLRALAQFNLAEAMLAALRGEPILPMTWHLGEITFTPDGRVTATR